jgi:5-carboxymethyl-2-hydroxymuconate isomerase
MPHLILEYSKNIDGGLNFEPLFVTLHQLLEKQLPTELSSCKSRCIPQELFFIGDCKIQNAFAHLTIKILAGRTDENKNLIGNAVLKEMSDFFQPLKQKLHLQLSVEVMDLDKHYFK